MTTRKEILELLAAGEITADEAEEMLNAARTPSEPVAPPPPPRRAVEPAPVDPANGEPRWLHIHVGDLATGKQRVRVNVPLGLVKFGIKLGSRFTDELDDDIMDSVMEALQMPDVRGTLVEVEDVDDNERVHIFVS